MLRGVMNTARKVSFPSRFECFPCLVKYLPESYWGTYNKSSCSRPAKMVRFFIAMVGVSSHLFFSRSNNQSPMKKHKCHHSQCFFL